MLEFIHKIINSFARKLMSAVTITLNRKYERERVLARVLDKYTMARFTRVIDIAAPRSTKFLGRPLRSFFPFFSITEIAM